MPLNNICTDSSLLAAETGAGISNNTPNAGSCCLPLAPSGCTQRQAARLPRCAESQHRLAGPVRLPLFGQTHHETCECGSGLCRREGHIPPAVLALASRGIRGPLRLRGAAGEGVLRVSGTSSQAPTLQSCPSTNRMVLSRHRRLHIDLVVGRRAAAVGPRHAATGQRRQTLRLQDFELRL